MAEKVERKGYSATKWKANRKGYQAEVIIAIENTGRVGDEILKSIVMSPKYNEAEKADMMQRCNDIRKSCTFGFMVLLILMAVTVLSILCTILFGEDIYKSLFSK